jgi:hypothetical protein
VCGDAAAREPLPGLLASNIADEASFATIGGLTD